MGRGFIDSLSLLDAVGQGLILAIVVSLIGALLANVVICSRYAYIARDLRQNARFDRALSTPVLTRIFQESQKAVARHGRDANLQAVIEHEVQSQLGGLLLGERFVRAAAGLVIVLGLAGTFYGLTSSIGKLVALVARDAPAGDITQALTTGLTDALGGMSVAFGTSLFGVGSAIVLTVVGVFSNVTDRRTALMIEIEATLERVLAPMSEGTGGGRAAAGAGAGAGAAITLDPVVQRFAEAVRGMQEAMQQFELGLENFGKTTRDFREFNLHLKDNVQRLSLNFADFSESLQAQVAALRGVERGHR